MYPFCYLCFVLGMLSCLFIAAFWPPAWKRAICNLLALLYVMFSCFMSLSHVCPGSGVLLDCIDS